MAYSILIPVIVGLVFSVPVNYLADVLPATRTFSQPVCAQCACPYSLKDYLLLKSCEQCGRRRSLRTWLTMILLALASAYLWTRLPLKADYTLSVLVLVYFAVVVVIDIEHHLILHPTSMVGGLLGFAIGWWKHGLATTVLGGLAGFIFMLALYFLGGWFTRYRTQRLEKAGQQADDEEALGFGDVTLAGVLGLLAGWPRVWTCLLQGILLAGIYSLLMVIGMVIFRRYKANALMTFVPYGPFLVVSAFLTLFVQNWAR